MSDWPVNIQSNTPEDYQFKLISQSDEVICSPQPLEWKSGTLEFKRDLESGGIFVSFVCDSLTFVGNGAMFLRNLFDAYSVNAKCTLVISWWKNFDHDNPTNSRQYIEFPTRYDINFNFYETVKVGRFFFGVRVKAVNNSVQTKLDNRQDVDVDISRVNDNGKITTIGGIEIDSYGMKDYLLKRLINYDATNVNYRAELNDLTGRYELAHVAHKVTYTSMPVKIFSTDKFLDEFTEVQNVSYITRTESLAAIPAFFKDAKVNYESLDIWYWLSVEVTDRYIGSFPWTIQLIETDSNGAIVGVPYELGGFGGLKKIYNITPDTVPLNVKCDKGNSLKLVVRSAGIDSYYTAYSIKQIIKITQQVSQSPAAQLEGYPLYEALERTVQHDLDVRYPIYSDFFGRTDVVYNSFGAKYSSENVLRFAHIQGGMNLRGAKLGSADAPLALSFKKLFASVKALYNVGYSLETNLALFGDNLPRIRIEEYAHFFQNTKIVFSPPISSRISKYDIQSQVMPELIPIDLKSGFDSFEYLTANGRAEPNTTNQRTSIMSTASKWENISPYRADTKGILDNISNPIGENGSTDTKGDSSVFIIKTRKHATRTNEWIPEKGELISIIEDTSLFKNDLMNRYYTPTRMLLRHGNRISSGMQKLDAQASVLRFQTSDKLCSLKTQATGEIVALAENSDIAVSSLDKPIYLPMKHTISVDFTNKDLEILQLTPFGYIDFGYDLKGNNITGFLLNLKKKNAGGKAEITIIERYVP